MKILQIALPVIALACMAAWLFLPYSRAEQYWLLTFQIQKLDKTLVTSTRFTNVKSPSEWLLEAQKHGNVCLLGAWEASRSDFESATAAGKCSTKELIEHLSK